MIWVMRDTWSFQTRLRTCSYIPEIQIINLCKRYPSFNVWARYLCGISKGTFEIPHTISYPYIERYDHFLQRWNCERAHLVRVFEMSPRPWCFWQNPSLSRILKFITVITVPKSVALWQCWYHGYSNVPEGFMDTSFYLLHWSDIIMGAMASQITSVSIVYSTVCSGEDQRKHQSFASLAFLREIHRWTVNHKGPMTRKMFPLDDVITVPKVAHFRLNPLEQTSPNFE